MSSGESRVAVVTGAGQGVGRAVAIALSQAGIRVAAVGRTQAKLDQTIALLDTPGIALSADLTDPGQVSKAFETAAGKLGGIDILVNCVADYSPFRVDEATDAQIDATVAQSFTSAIYCMRDAINHMRKRGGGDIVNISSQSAEMPQPFMTIYGACKAALEALSQGLRWELKGEDFRVIVCQIGVVRGTTSSPVLLNHRERKEALWRETGIDKMYAFPGAPPETIAASVLQAIQLPRSAYVETVRLRGSFVPDED